MSKKLSIGFVGILAMLAMLGAMGGTARAGGEVDTTFNPDNFPNPQVSPGINDINNSYWPLPVRTTFVYRSVDDECEVNDVEVTSNTKMIAGITTREVHDQVWVDEDCDGDRDFLSENTLDWYAQDNKGNIWYFGEDTCEIDESGDCDTAGSWEADVDGAEPGIIILAHPRPGDFYQQEFYEDEAEDLGKVTRLNARVSLVFDNTLDPDEYEGCMKTKEWSPLERGAIEFKYYCPGVGLVLIEEHMGKTVRTELVDVVE